VKPAALPAHPIRSIANGRGKEMAEGPGGETQGKTRRKTEALSRRQLTCVTNIEILQDGIRRLFNWWALCWWLCDDVLVWQEAHAYMILDLIPSLL